MTPDDNEAQKTGPVEGPWSQTKTTEYKIAPISITIVTKTESTHVPPDPVPVPYPPPGMGPDGDRSPLISALHQALSMIMERLDKIKAAQGMPMDPH
jgi:hypothetical protein